MVGQFMFSSLLPAAERLVESAGVRECKASMAELCKQALQHNWSGNPKQPVKANVLTFLLVTYFGSCEDAGLATERLALHVVPDMIANVTVAADDHTQELEPSVGSGKSVAAGAKRAAAGYMVSREYATMTKHTFPVYFRVMLATLAELMAAAQVEQLSGANVVALIAGKSPVEAIEDADTIVGRQLSHLACLCKVFFGLVKLTKFQTIRSKAVMLATVKYARLLIENFIKSW